jgi:predicted dehydrogenase
VGEPHTKREGRQRVMDGFASAILEGRPVPVTGQDGRAALEVALSAYQAGAQGSPVELKRR